MFRRKRSQSSPPVKTPPNAAASTAAVQAFLANRASNANLSNAAAAAALRSHTPPPTNPADVQTKRMARRGSVSSVGAASPSSALQRRDSSGSMTERTFRTPSPNRPSEAVPPDADAPPVPSLPPQIPAKSVRRPASVEPPQRLLSPPPKPHGRGASLDRGSGALAALRSSQERPPLPALKTAEDPNSARKRDSVNFSRPMSPTNSPQGSPATRRPASAKETIQDPSTKSPLNPSVPAKKKEPVGRATPSDHPGAPSKTMTALNPVDFTPMKQPPSPDPPRSQARPLSQITTASATPPVTPKKKKKKVSVPSSSSDLSASYPSDNESVTSERSTTSEVSRSYNTRAAGMLAKRPSVVREDKEAEAEEDASPYSRNSGMSTQPLHAKPKTKTKAATEVAVGQSHGRSSSQPLNAAKAVNASSLDIPNGTLHGSARDSDLRVGSNRPQSLSPARSAHFSVKPIMDGERHQPPGRSVSPAKSAMKHSPSRGPSPIGGVKTGTNRKLGPGSEVSDRSSVVSEEGQLLNKPKKSARVSFDEGSVVSGRAATPPTDTEFPVMTSPQNKDPSSKRWFGGNRDRKASSDEEGVIQPTPVLPSFGSVRRQKPDGAAEGQRDSPGFANDEKIGAILSRVFNDQGKETELVERSPLVTDAPVPPQVTSVDGNGELSGSEYSTRDKPGEGKPVDRPQVMLPISSGEEPAGKSDGAAGEPLGLDEAINVPQIAVQPATPGLGDITSESKDYVNVSNPSVPPVDPSPTMPTPAGLGLAEPTPETEHAVDDPNLPIVGHVSDGLRKQIDADSDSEGSAVFSDAAEDMSDLEGDGFGSINAIVESPTSAASPFPKPEIPNSPVSQGKEKEALHPSPLAKEIGPSSSSGSDADWEKARSYWSGVNRRHEEQTDAEATPASASEITAPVRKSEKKPVSAHGPNQPPLPPWPDRQYQEDIARSASPKASGAKKVTRPKSTTATPEAPARSSMRNSAPPRTASKQSPKSTVEPVNTARGPLHEKKRSFPPVSKVNADKRTPKNGHARISSTDVSPLPVASSTRKTGKPKAKPMLTRNDSDSSSSFRRARSKTPDNGRYTMRRSMRGDAASSRPSSAMVGPPSSTSHGGGRRPVSISGPPAMRTSLRGSAESKPPRTSLRTSVEVKAERTKSPSRFSGFGRKQKQAASSVPGSRFSSRFGDSSDDDDGPSLGRSRFEDSSEDDELTSLTPVRGIPRCTEEGDSTDLEDSSADERQKALAAKPEPVHPATAAEGNALSTGSLRTEPEPRDKGKKKRPFFSRIGSKRKETPPAPTPFSTPGKVAEPAVARGKPVASLDTAAAATAAAAASPKSPKSPKLQRRITADRVASLSAKSSNPTSPNPQALTVEQAKKIDPSSWPLPADSSAAVTPSRPSTSDGVGARKDLGTGLRARSAGKEKRPALNGRSATVDEEGNILSAKTGKKKRFQGLRKLVGLHD